MGDWSGTVPTFAAGAKLRGADMQTMADIATALTGAWTSWTPTLTNMTLGNGTVTAKYRRLGKTFEYHFKFVLGSTSAMSTNPTFSIPAGLTLSSDYAIVQDPLGDVSIRDSGTANYRGAAHYGTSTTIALFWYNATPVLTGISSTSPMTWTTSDAIACHGIAEIA